jgi:uncharacterized protein YodC (DUF2158 family)
MTRLLSREEYTVKSRDTLLKEASGTVTSDDPMVGFVYDLLRDYVRPGDMERAVENNLYKGTCTFSNGWLAKYAKDVVETLTKPLENGPVVGDTVTLISGGPLMTVTDVAGTTCNCSWFLTDRVFSEWFAKGSLTVVKKKEKVENV